MGETNCAPGEICGNGTLDCTDECDDGNLQGGDGCAPTCREERCGNAIVDVDVDGALLVRAEGGTVQRVLAGTFPPENAFLAGAPFAYFWFYHVVLAGAARLTAVVGTPPSGDMTSQTNSLLHERTKATLSSTPYTMRCPG